MPHHASATTTAMVARWASLARPRAEGEPVGHGGQLEHRAPRAGDHEVGADAALGASAAVLNHPAKAIVMLVKHLAERGEVLPAGSDVMTGGNTEAIPVAAGDSITARVQDMGAHRSRLQVTLPSPSSTDASPSTSFFMRRMYLLLSHPQCPNSTQFDDDAGWVSGT